MAPGFTIKTSEEFIQSFEQQPVLYNIRDPGYFKKEVRRRALEEMCSQLALPFNDDVLKALTEKIRQLRSAFSRHLRLWNSSKKSGAATNDVEQPSWRWFPHLTFLTPHIKLRKGTSNLNFEITDEHDFDEEDQDINYNQVEIGVPFSPPLFDEDLDDDFGYDEDDQRSNQISSVPPTPPPRVSPTSSNSPPTPIPSPRSASTSPPISARASCTRPAREAPAFSTAGSSRAPAFSTAGTSRAPAISTAGTSRAPAISTAGSSRAPAISTAGSSRAPAISTAGSSRAPAISTAGSSSATAPAKKRKASAADISETKGLLKSLIASREQKNASPNHHFGLHVANLLDQLPQSVAQRMQIQILQVFDSSGSHFE